MVESQSIDQRPDELIFKVPADSSMQTDVAIESAQIGSDQHSTGTFGSCSSGPVSFVSNTSSGQPVPKKRGRPRKGEAPSGQIDQKPKRQFLTIGDWGFWLIPKTPEGSTTYAPTQTAVSESWRLRDHIAASDDLNPNWRTRETDISNLLKLFLATADAHAIVQSNQERTPVQDQILFLGDLGQEVFIGINRHMRSIKSGLQDQDSDVYNRGLRWLRLAAPIILQIASVYCRQPYRMTSFELKQPADQTPSEHPSATIDVNPIENSMIPAGTVTTQPSSGHHIAPSTVDFNHNSFVTAGTAMSSVGPSASRFSSQSIAQTGKLVRNEKPKRVRMPFKPHTTDDGVWTYYLTEKPTESFSPDVTAVAYLRALRDNIRSLDRTRSGWRDEGGSGKKDFSNLVDLILATQGAEEIAQKEERTPEDDKILILAEMGQAVVDNIKWHVLRPEGNSKEEDRARSLAWVHEISPVMVRIAGGEFQKTDRLTSIGKTQQHKADIAEHERKRF